MSGSELADLSGYALCKEQSNSLVLFSDYFYIFKASGLSKDFDVKLRSDINTVVTPIKLIMPR